MLLTHSHIRSHSGSFQGIRWIFVSLLPKINVARCACVCAHCHMCVCVLSFVSSQLNLANLPPPPSAILHIPLSLSLSSSSSSLSLMNRLNFLMSCFYGLLMLIYSSPYAPSLHPSVSRCLPRLIHPFFSPLLLLQPHSYLPSLPAATMFISTGAGAHTHTHTCSQSPIQRSDVCAPHLLPTADFRSWEKNCVRLWMFMCTCFQGKTKKITFKIPVFNTVSLLNY